MKTRQIVGAALLAVGLLMAFNAFPLATVIYPEKFWYQLYPGGTSDNPTLISPGATITLSAWLVYYDGSKTPPIELPSPVNWVVQVSINGQSSTLSYKGTDSVPNYAFAKFEKSWTVPAGEGVSYVLTWTAIIYDANRNEVGRFSTTTYAKTADIEPDGTFYINDQNAAQTTTLVVGSSGLSFKFAASKNGDKITGVYVDVIKGGSKVATVTLSGANPTWTGTYSLPGYGTYTLNGYFTWTGSTTPVQKMSIMANLGGESQLPISTTTTISMTQVLGIGLAALGAVLTFKKRW